MSKPARRTTSSGGEATPPSSIEAAGLNVDRTFEYDTGLCDFTAALVELLGLPDDVALQNLHVRTDVDAEKLVTKWNMATRQQSFQSGRFAATLARFVEQVVAPGMAASPGMRIVYQERPSLRVQLPGHSGIKLHTDREYHHQPAEVNWWVPLTPTFGTNTLFLESCPGKGDYRPVELEPGQALRFYGNACRHYTETNCTDSTRVSFDVRVCRGDMYDKDSPVSRHPKTGEQRFAVGAYYTEIIVGRGRPSQQDECEGRRNEGADAERCGRGKGKGEKPSKAWRSFRDRFLQQAAAAVRLPQAIDSGAAADLEVALGDAARAGIAPSFANPGARSGYTLSHLSPRAGHLANVLMLGSQTMTDIRESVFLAGIEGSASQVSTIASIGGGPGFDAVAAAMVGEFLASQQASKQLRRLNVLVCDNEPGWADCVTAVAASLPSPERHRVSFATADILLPLSDLSNSALSETAPSTDLFVFAHVVVENARGLVQTRMRFIRDVLSKARVGAAMVFTDNTHRLWAPILDQASAAAGDADLQFAFEVAFPTVRGKPGYSLALRKVGREAGPRGAHSQAGPLIFEGGQESEALLARFRLDFDRWASSSELQSAP